MTYNSQPIKVRAYEFPTMNFAGEFESIDKAARKLFIRYPKTIWGHLFKCKNKGSVSSYKDGKKYQFEQVKKTA